jgi:hypothetical protein
LERLAIEHLLADVVVDLYLQLVRIRRAIPSPRERLGKPIDVGSAHHDVPVGTPGLGVAATKYSEQQATKQQKVKQWLA